MRGVFSQSRRRVALLCLTLVGAAFGAVGSAGAQQAAPLATPLVADLDGDSALEAVRVREISCAGPGGPSPPPCPPTGGRTIVVEVVDVCPNGQVRTLTLSREMDFVQFAAVLDANGDGRARELAFAVAAGAAGRTVQAKVVRFKRGSDGCIAVRKTAFSYPRAATVGRRPTGTNPAGVSVMIANFSSARRGLEVRVREFYVREGDAYCCPSFRRTTFFTYSRKRGAYRRYRSVLHRIATTG